ALGGRCRTPVVPVLARIADRPDWSRRFLKRIWNTAAAAEHSALSQLAQRRQALLDQRRIGIAVRRQTDALAPLRTDHLLFLDLGEQGLVVPAIPAEGQDPGAARRIQRAVQLNAGYTLQAFLQLQ